jgi:hypothetical protein
MNPQTIFMASYFADPTANGLVAALNKMGISCKALPGQLCSADEVPDWIDKGDDKKIEYYFQVPANDMKEAKLIADRMKHPRQRWAFPTELMSEAELKKETERLMFEMMKDDCEVGVFVLRREGWWIWRRERFRDAKIGANWAERELSLLKSAGKFRRFRVSIVAEPETLEGVRDEYERLRRQGDPNFIDSK